VELAASVLKVEDGGSMFLQTVDIFLPEYTQLHIPEDFSYNHRCENLEFYNVMSNY
jgi:hypothetical protein